MEGPVECTNIPLPMTSHTFSRWDTNWKDALPLLSDVMEPRSPAGWGKRGEGRDRRGGEGNGSCESESYIPRRETQDCCVNVRVCVCQCVDACMLTGREPSCRLGRSNTSPQLQGEKVHTLVGTLQCLHTKA